MSDLTVITVVENDPGLVELMVKSVLRFTEPKPKFIFCDNSGGKNHKRIQSAMKNFDQYEIIDNDPSIEGGSNRHGHGLNKIFPYVNTKYTAIVESDVAVLSRDWYKISSGFKAKGASKAQHIYHACFFIFETEAFRNHPKNGRCIDFRPGKPHERKSGASYSKDRDVGWDLSNFIFLTDVDFMTFVDCNNTDATFGKMQSDTFYYNGQLI